MLTPGTARREPSPEQLAAVQRVMQLLVEEDLAKGVAPTARGYCDGCARPRPLPGFVRYGRYELCSTCATEFEVAQAWVEPVTVGQFVRDKRFGEADRYALPAEQ